MFKQTLVNARDLAENWLEEGEALSKEVDALVEEGFEVAKKLDLEDFGVGGFEDFVGFVEESAKEKLSEASEDSCEEWPEGWLPEETWKRILKSLLVEFNAHWEEVRNS